MSRQAVGITGKIWRKVLPEEREGYRTMAKEGFSLRDIGLKFNRDHRVIAYNLKDEKDRLLASKKAHERRIAKKRKPTDHVRLTRKLCSCVCQARQRAEHKNLPIDIDAKFLMELYKQQKGACALTGIMMKFKPMPGLRANPYAVSLDRIDSKLGYIRNNVRLVIWCINWSIGEWGEQHFEEIIKTYLTKKYGSRLFSLISP